MQPNGWIFELTSFQGDTPMVSDTRLTVDGYTRVSTEEQARGGYSLDAQESKIRGYCALYDLDLARILSDPGESGKNLNRPGIRAVLEDLRVKRVDGLVIAKLDRLSRSLRDWSNLIDEFFAEKAGLKLFSVNDSIDTRSASGRLVLNVLMSVAQWEREIIGERTKDALRSKIARGERVGKVRFGHDLAPDGRTLVPNIRQQAAIAAMKEWRLQGKTYREMATLVAGLGIETAEGNLIWQPATVRRILERSVG